MGQTDKVKVTIHLEADVFDRVTSIKASENEKSLNQTISHLIERGLDSKEDKEDAVINAALSIVKSIDRLQNIAKDMNAIRANAQGASQASFATLAMLSSLFYLEWHQGSEPNGANQWASMSLEDIYALYVEIGGGLKADADSFWQAFRDTIGKRRFKEYTPFGLFGISGEEYRAKTMKKSTEHPKKRDESDRG